MKTLVLLFALTLSLFAAEPKRPLGVPADAKHFNGRWYKVYLEKKTWHAARDKCKELGGRLVCVQDAPTWEFVKTLTAGASMWLGATDEETEGMWKWVDGSAMEFSAWGRNQPDNAGKSENYAITWSGAWADIGKTPAVGNVVVVGYVCEWR